MGISEFWDSTLADMIRYINARARMSTAQSREQWSIMRYQTALILRMAQDSKAAPIQPVDILAFEDEQPDAEAMMIDAEIMAERDRKLNAGYLRKQQQQA